jgi:hypothetical protein
VPDSAQNRNPLVTNEDASSQQQEVAVVYTEHTTIYQEVTSSSSQEDLQSDYMSRLEDLDP